MTELPWLIFDADNTLWDIEALYDSAREKFCKFVVAALDESGANKSGHVTIEMVELCQQQRDEQLYKTHSYSAARFARSFEDTFTFLCLNASVDQIKHVRKLAMDVFEETPAPTAGLESVLSALRPRFRFAIITAGEQWVQERRLQQFHLREHFSKIIVVPQKTADVFRQFCTDNSADPASCCVVGDSVKSDIMPALQARLRAVHVRAKNWSIERAPLPEKVPSIGSLTELPALFTVSDQTEWEGDRSP